MAPSDSEEELNTEQMIKAQKKNSRWGSKIKWVSIDLHKLRHLYDKIKFGVIQWINTNTSIT